MIIGSDVGIAKHNRIKVTQGLNTCSLVSYSKFSILYPISLYGILPRGQLFRPFFVPINYPSITLCITSWLTDGYKTRLCDSWCLVQKFDPNSNVVAKL